MDIPLYFYIAYKGLDRLSPGSEETTNTVIDKINFNIDDELNILDIGCGVGQATMLLANHFKNAEIESIDRFKHYLSVLDDNIKENNLESRIFTYQMDMRDLDFANEDFDIVYSEASIEIIGFKKGLNEWKRLLKPNGYMIISDVSWIGKASKQSRNFWKNTYDEIDTIENKISQIKDEGYDFIDYVIVSKEDWKSYHEKLEENLNKLKGDASAKDFLSQLKKEIKVYRQNSDDYSYVFYIMKKLV